MQLLRTHISALNNTRIAEIFVSFRKSGSGNKTVTSDFRPEVEIRPFRVCAMKNMRNISLIYRRIAETVASLRTSGSRNTMVTLDLRAEVEIWPFRACAMHPAIIGTVRSLWTWLWGRYHVPENVFLVIT